MAPGEPARSGLILAAEKQLVEGWRKLGRSKPARIVLAAGALFLIAPVTWGIAAGAGLAALAWAIDRFMPERVAQS